jgi:V-type H+-transporting ATPase subunit a
LIGRKCLIAEGWCPEKDIEAVQLALRRATTASGALVPSFLSVVNTKVRVRFLSDAHSRGGKYQEFERWNFTFIPPYSSLRCWLQEEPPTYFRLNKYTAAFHGLVAAYGVPRYGEINPSTRIRFHESIL